MGLLEHPARERDTVFSITVLVEEESTPACPVVYTPGYDVKTRVNDAWWRAVLGSSVLLLLGVGLEFWKAKNANVTG